MTNCVSLKVAKLEVYVRNNFHCYFFKLLYITFRHKIISHMGILTVFHRGRLTACAHLTLPYSTLHAPLHFGV